jgi:hypothetical protein
MIFGACLPHGFLHPGDGSNDFHERRNFSSCRWHYTFRMADNL